MGGGGGGGGRAFIVDATRLGFARGEGALVGRGGGSGGGWTGRSRGECAWRKERDEVKGERHSWARGALDSARDSLSLGFGLLPSQLRSAVLV